MPELWWTKYLHDGSFRISEELKAYAKQYAFVRKNTNARIAKECLDDLSYNLASPMYKLGITKPQAETMIRERVYRALPMVQESLRSKGPVLETSNSQKNFPSLPFRLLPRKQRAALTSFLSMDFTHSTTRCLTVFLRPGSCASVAIWPSTMS